MREDEERKKKRRKKRSSHNAKTTILLSMRQPISRTDEGTYWLLISRWTSRSAPIEVLVGVMVRTNADSKSRLRRRPGPKYNCNEFDGGDRAVRRDIVSARSGGCAVLCAHLQFDCLPRCVRLKSQSFFSLLEKRHTRQRCVNDQD